MKRPDIIFFVLIFFTLTGLFFISTGFLSNYEVKIDQKKGINFQSDSFTPSQEFKNIEKALLGLTNLSALPNSINQLKNEFEKKYLSALLSRRKGDYKNSFNLLFSMLSDYPNYYPYYDELIFSAKASDELKQIQKIIESEKPGHKYYDYLRSLYFYHTNQYSKALESLNTQNDFEQMYLLSYSYRGLGDYENALIALKKAKGLLEKGSYELSKILISEGSLYLLSGRYNEAAKLYNAGLESAKQTGNKKEEAKALINLAIIDDHNGNVDEAKSKLENAIKISEAIGDKELLATALSELAVSYTYSGNVVEAKNNYEKSYEIFRVLNHKERLSNLCANIASLYAQTGNYSTAVEYYNDGLNYAGDNVISKILNLRGLGDVYSNLSNYSKSIEYYEEAKKLAKQIKDISTESSVDVSIGTLYYNINKPKKALQIFLKAKDKFATESEPYLAEDLYFKIGLAYAAIDSLNASNSAFITALNISKSLNDVYYTTVILTELGNNYLFQNNISIAERNINKAMELSRRNGFNQLIGLQNLYLGKIALAKNDFSGAIKYFESASLIAEREMDYNNVFEAEYLIAKVLYKQKKLSESEKHYLKAINLSDKISESLVNNAEIQIAHFSGINDCYSELAELYLQQNRNEEAFAIIEKSRSRNTFQNLLDLRINSSGISKDKLQRYYDLKWMVESGLYSGNSLAELSAEYVILKNEIEKSSTLLQNKLNDFDLRSIQKELSQDENLITLFVGNENLYCFKLNREKFSVVKSTLSGKDVVDLLKKISPLYSSDYQNTNLYYNQDLFSFNTKYANEFYKNVLQPILKDIPKSTKLIFSLPSELVMVPFEFLVTEFEDDDSPFYYDNKKYLIDDYAISYSPSSSIYVLQKSVEHKNEEKVLLVGDPQISSQDFALSYRGSMMADDSFNARNIVLFPLKYSKEEIQKLNSLFSNGLTLLSDDATEKKFKENAEQSSIIHLSTHSFLHKNQPLIIFSQNRDEPEDGYLERGEILQLKLNSDLVVLSSCRSGLGEIDESEGVIGMQKSFFEAGAKSVVVSLWDVNDKYTSLFMQSFYKFLSEGFDKSEALRRAKLYFKENYSANPYYWAAFILSGNTSSIEFAKSGFFSIYLILIFISLLIISFLVYIKIKKN